MSQSKLYNLPKPRAASPTQRLIKPQSVPKPVQHRSLSPIRKSQVKNESFSGNGVDFQSRYEYLLPKPPVVLLESAQLAQILNYAPTDRELLYSDICDFDINVEQGIPFSGSIRAERKWAKTMQQEAIKQAQDQYKLVQEDNQYGQEYQDADFQNYASGSRPQMMMTELDDKDDVQEVKDINELLDNVKQ